MLIESSSPATTLGAADEAANAEPGPGWSTDGQLREHMLGNVTEAKSSPETVEQVEEGGEVLELPAATDDSVIEAGEKQTDESAVENSEQAEEPAAQPSPELLQLQDLVRQSNERFERLLAVVEAKNAAPPEQAKEAEPVPDPWSRPSADHLRVAARQQLGDVSPQILDQYKDQLGSLATWERAADDTPDKAINIERIRGNMRELHLRAKHETDTAEMRESFEKRISQLEGQPAKLASAAKVESTIRKQFTAPNLVKADYPNLAKAVEAGTIDIDTVLHGLDFGAITLGDSATYEALESRLEFCNQLLAGVASKKAPATPPQAKAPAKVPPPAQAGIRLANPSSLAIPDQPGSTEAPVQKFLEDSDYDALMRKHLTMVVN